MRNLLAILLIVAALAVAGAASADVDIFNGTLKGVTVGGWGSGSTAPAQDRPLVGTLVVRVTTQGLHEGGRLDLADPVEIISDSVDNDYVKFAVRFSTVSLTSPNTFFGPGFGIVSTPGLLNPKMAAYFYQDTEAPLKAKVNFFRFELVSSDDRYVEGSALVPMNAEDGWFKIAVPLKVLGFKQGDSFKVKRVLIFSDVADTFAIGQISVIKDDSPITASAGEDQVVAVNDVVIFQAEAEGGASQLKYSWNFGDSGTSGEDATGEIATHRYKGGGDFKVKLTVSDVWGIKAPVTAETICSVND